MDAVQAPPTTKSALRELATLFAETVDAPSAEVKETQDLLIDRTARLLVETADPLDRMLIRYRLMKMLFARNKQAIGPELVLAMRNELCEPCGDRAAAAVEEACRE